MNSETGAQRLYKAFSRFQRIRWKPSPIEGLRYSEIPVLDSIRRSERGSLTISEISGDLDLASPTVTQMVNSLEKKGFVKRRTGKHDRRVVDVSLTPKGFQVLEEADKRLLATFTAMSEYLGEEDSRILAAIIDKIYSYFSENKE